MVIGRFQIPLYGKFIVLSILLSILFNYLYLRREGINKRLIVLSILMVLCFCIIGAKILTLLVTDNNKLNLFNAGLSSYGGAIGIIVGSVIFAKLSNESRIIKSNILSLPFMYSMAKLGCFFGGCCYGIPYNGIFSVTYTDGLNIPLFPVQLLESLIFLFIFIFCLLNQKNRNVLELLVIICAITKFSLDYFRYSHLDKILSINQIVSLFIIFLCIIILIFKYYKIKKKR